MLFPLFCFFLVSKVAFHWHKRKRSIEVLIWIEICPETLPHADVFCACYGVKEKSMEGPSVSQQRVTELLADWGRGDDAAFAKLTPLIYEELRRLAHNHMSGQRPDHTLQTTALVNEAYLRLADQTNPSWQNRAHFFAVAARAMRQIVVDYARSQQSQKRGGGALKVELDEAAIVSPEQSKEIVNLHEALERLATLDSRKAQVVELKYFGGLNYDEMAEVLKISPVTVRRDWEFAKLWLYTELHNEG
jgi:RNA polymerase sigma-70 factor, ECF subfamily